MRTTGEKWMASLSFFVTVNHPFETVVAGFDESLFRYLTNQFPPVHVERFDGVYLDAMVHLRIGGRWGPRWVSKITATHLDADTYSFTDVGITLPPGLREWNHVHRCRKLKNGTTEIADLVTFTAHPLLEPLFEAGFRREIGSRGKKYRQYFEGAQKTQSSDH
jgi:ligand-binding SRPBCC domain-containing protein